MRITLGLGLSLLLAGSALGGVPVTPASDQSSLLASTSRQLAEEKTLVYDFWRTVIIGRHLEHAAEYLSVDYIQHNPNVLTGLSGFLEFFKKLGPPRDIPGDIPGLVTIRAEGDTVTLAFVNKLADAHGQAYTTTWFDMFRVANGKIVEHWDCDTASP